MPLDVQRVCNYLCQLVPTRVDEAYISSKKSSIELNPQGNKSNIDWSPSR